MLWSLLSTDHHLVVFRRRESTASPRPSSPVARQCWWSSANLTATSQSSISRRQGASPFPISAKSTRRCCPVFVCILSQLELSVGGQGSRRNKRNERNEWISCHNVQCTYTRAMLCAPFYVVIRCRNIWSNDLTVIESLKSLVCIDDYWSTRIIIAVMLLLLSYCYFSHEK